MNVCVKEPCWRIWGGGPSSSSSGTVGWKPIACFPSFRRQQGGGGRCSGYSVAERLKRLNVPHSPRPNHNLELSGLPVMQTSSLPPETVTPKRGVYYDKKKYLNILYIIFIRCSCFFFFIVKCNYRLLIPFFVHDEQFWEKSKRVIFYSLHWSFFLCTCDNHGFAGNSLEMANVSTSILSQ